MIWGDEEKRELILQRETRNNSEWEPSSDRSPPPAPRQQVLEPEDWEKASCREPPEAVAG